MAILNLMHFFELLSYRCYLNEENGHTKRASLNASFKGFTSNMHIWNMPT